MITIKINGEEQRNADISEQWIAEQINNRRRENQPICVKLGIRCGDIDIILPGGQCPSTGGGRPVSSFNARVQKVIRYWEDKGFREKKINAAHFGNMKGSFVTRF